MQRAPFFACLSFGLLSALATTAVSQNPSQVRRNPVSQDHAALPYQVHIAPTTLPDGSTSIEAGADTWSARGYDLRTLIAQIYNVDARRVDFPDSSVAGKRFDISVDLPAEVTPDVMQQLLEDAIEKRFGLHITPQSQPMNVYVLTAPAGPGTAMKQHRTGMGEAEVAGFGTDAADEDSARITFYGKDCSGVASSNGISVSAATISDLRRTLEPDLDRVLLDETHLTGSYDFTVGNYADQQELFRRLHDQLGLVITPAQRSVTVLAVRPTASSQSLEAQL